jgi:hypothetical protein
MDWSIAAAAAIARTEAGKAALGQGSWTTADGAAQTAISAGAAVNWADSTRFFFGDEGEEFSEVFESNVLWHESWGRAEFGTFRPLAQQLSERFSDPRTPFKKCGEWRDPNEILGPKGGDGLISGTIDPRFIDYGSLIPEGVFRTGLCDGEGSHAIQGADGDHAHYKQMKYSDRGSDIVRLSGEEMLLIRAEAAMRRDDFSSMVGFLNQVRLNRGLPAYSFVPTSLGTLEYPHDVNSEEAIDLLERERYASMWLEGRRLFDMSRWDHPFLQGGSPNWVVGESAFSPRASCLPVPG